MVVNADNKSKSQKFDIMVGAAKNEALLLERFPSPVDQASIRKFFKMLEEIAPMYGDVAMHKFAPIWFTKCAQLLRDWGIIARRPVETIGMRPGNEIIREITDNKELQSVFFYDLAAIGELLVD